MLLMRFEPGSATWRCSGLTTSTRSRWIATTRPSP